MLTLICVFILVCPRGSDTKLRPTFQELMDKLRDLQRKYMIQFQATRAALSDNSLLKDN